MFISIIEQTNGYKVNGMFILATTIKDALAEYLCISDAGARAII